MSIIREQIRYLGNTTNIKFNLSSNDNLLGYQQEIDNLTQVVSFDLVNPPVDVEERRFKNSLNGGYNNIKFYFTLNGTTYDYNYKNAGFTENEIVGNSSSKLNSFYIFDYYDSYDINKQTKILTTYITKITNSPNFNISTDNQIFYWYIPVSYINANIDLGITKVTGYTKFSFFNANIKNGNNLILFYNKIYQNLTTPQRMYFTTEIDFVNKTWRFINPSTILAYQLWNSYEYINKVNKGIVKYDNQSQNYPNGSAFIKETGKYV